MFKHCWIPGGFQPAAMARFARVTNSTVIWFKGISADLKQLALASGAGCRRYPGNRYRLTVFFDGGCAPCRSKVRLLQRATGDLVQYVDIDESHFDPASIQPGLSIDYFLLEIRALRSDGIMLSGLDAVRAVYEVAGLGWLWIPVTWPVVGPMVEALYRVFARYRYCNRAIAGPLNLTCRQ